MWSVSATSQFGHRCETPHARQWIADFVVVTRSLGSRKLDGDLERARQSLSAAGLTFPLVARPDLTRHGAHPVAGITELRECLRWLAAGEKLILQRLAPAAGEAAVLYARLPGAQNGRILSLTFRLDAGGEGGVLCRDARRCITPELEARVDAVAHTLHEFHFGCFVLRFASPAELMRGELLCIVEISGIGSEAIDARDPQLPLSEAYRRSVERQRIMFLIGDRNRARGFEPVGLPDVLKSLVRHGEISRRYPASARAATRP